jgi:hypothetical protein
MSFYWASTLSKLDIKAHINVRFISESIFNKFTFSAIKDNNRFMSSVNRSFFLQYQITEENAYFPYFEK